MAPNEQETSERVAPSAQSDVLCGSVFLRGAFVVELPASGEVGIGRDADNDLPLADPSLSRRHALLRMRGEHALVIDLGSRNGTFVNGERVGEDGCRVSRGDEIALGSVRVALLPRTMVPSAVRPMLVRGALLQRIDADRARPEGLEVLALRLPASWYESEAVREMLGGLPASAYVGAVDERTLVVVAPAGGLPEPAHLAARDIHAGASPLPLGAARSARDVVDAAVGALGPLAARSAPPSVGPPGAAMSASSVGPPGAVAMPASSVGPRGAAAAPASSVGPAGAAAMQILYEQAAKVAPTGVGVLLMGETGVGKEVLARFIHERSGRQGPLVSVNTAALPEALVESELFGHERGAFSGAHQAKIGLIESAQGGTLFLDEIGDLPFGLQAKLLRVLEEHSVRRVGATQERRVDVRVVAATHKDLERAIAEGGFRRDLLYRLNACTLAIPPLRERVEEIEGLAVKFLEETVGAAGPGARLSLSPHALDALRRYAWPGNVRELRNVIERGVALARGGRELTLEHLPEPVRAPVPSQASPASAAVRDEVKEYERQRILEALDKAGGNQTLAAKLLGLPRRTLAYRMARLGIRGSP